MVLRTGDPTTLEDIDAVFVTVEPNGESHHPTGKQFLFGNLRVWLAWLQAWHRIEFL
jgi:hypothetical protein